MSSTLVLQCVTIILVLQRFSELVLARRNERRARERGGIEIGRGHYPTIVLLHVCWFLAFNAEGLIRGSAAPAIGVFGLWWLWLSIFVCAQLLRYWAIASLGDAWNTRIIVIPGNRRVARGPYALIPHPNYVAVIMEFIAVPLLVNAPVTACVGTVLNLALLLAVRIPAERTAVELLAGAEQTP
jgi:methyltransferase